MSSISQLLEAFDDAAQTCAEHPEYARGFAAGLARAAEQDATTAAMAADTFGRLIEDANFSYSEARRAVLRDIDALVGSLLGTLMPAVVDQSLLVRVREAVNKAAEDRLSHSPRFQMHPTTWARIAPLMSTVGDAGPEVLCSDTLPQDSILIRAETADQIVDLSDVIAAFNTACAIVLTAPETPIAKET